ncbi:hypothetical protein MMC25_003004 [Agyrium rufum]|nr:hypothetical protein [Agyrium rufum]
MAAAMGSFRQDPSQSKPHVPPTAPPTPPAKDAKYTPQSHPRAVDDYFAAINSRSTGQSRPTSIYSLSRNSFSSQLSQLTTIPLPTASQFSESIAVIPTAAQAMKAITSAAHQIQQWIAKAAEVLEGLDADDDVEWAAAGGREGLGEVDIALKQFESLVNTYVTAIEDVQDRKDVGSVPTIDLRDVVEEMELTISEWENVLKFKKSVKQQVEMAMEWEELWNTVIGDISHELEGLDRVVYEMEEKRHRDLSTEEITEDTANLDIQELETIVEDSPLNGGLIKRAANRLSMPLGLPTSSPLPSPGLPAPQDDASLLALFARMQPLRASLDFLPMRLSNFATRADKIFPSACQELTSRRKILENRWKRLDRDAEKLRQELSEDRWVLVFRNAGRQAQKMCESVEKSIGKIHEAADAGWHQTNPSALVKKVENYEAKKTHYGPAIQRVIAIIDKGMKDRMTSNGEVIKLNSDTQRMWGQLETDIKGVDALIEDLAMIKSQQLRDSISTIISMDRSTSGSAIETPGSSPASSIATGSSTIHKHDISTPVYNGSSRRSSIYSATSSRPPGGKRNASLPPTSAPAKTSQRPSPQTQHRVVTSSNTATLRSASPYATRRSTSTSTSTPGSHSRPSIQSEGNKPRWNSSNKVNFAEFKPYNYRPQEYQPPLKHSSSTYNHLFSSSTSARSSHSYLRDIGHHTAHSPLGRESSASPAPSASSMVSRPRSRLNSGSSYSNHGPPLSGLGIKSHNRNASPSPARSAAGSIDLPRTRQYTPNTHSQPPPSNTRTVSTPAISAPTGEQKSSKLLSFSERRQSMMPLTPRIDSRSSSTASQQRNTLHRQPMSSPLVSTFQPHERQNHMARSGTAMGHTYYDSPIPSIESPEKQHRSNSTFAVDDSPSFRASSRVGYHRSSTAMGNESSRGLGNRTSMLPVPVGGLAVMGRAIAEAGSKGNGRESAIGGRMSSLGAVSAGRKSVLGGKFGRGGA